MKQADADAAAVEADLHTATARMEDIEQGEQAAQILRRAAAASAPLDLAASGHALGGGLNRLLYARHFLVTLKAKARVASGETVVITGAGGGVGIHAVQLAKAAGAQVVAVTGSPQKEGAIRAAGADHVVVARGGDFSPQVREVSGQQGVQVALEIVGAETFPWTLRCLEPGGRLVFVGNVTGKPVELKPAVVILKDLEISGATNTTRQELEEVIALVAEGRVRPQVAAAFPLEQLPEALERLQRDRPLGRLVVRPNGGVLARAA